VKEFAESKQGLMHTVTIIKGMLLDSEAKGESLESDKASMPNA
jgi:hypothetical protein